MNSHSVIWRVTAHLTCLVFFLCFVFSRRDAADIQSGTVCTDGSSITAQAGIEASVQSVIALLERNKGIRLRWSVFLDRMWPVDPPGVIFTVFSAAAVRQAGNPVSALGAVRGAEGRNRFLAFRSRSLWRSSARYWNDLERRLSLSQRHHG